MKKVFVLTFILLLSVSLSLNAAALNPSLKEKLANIRFDDSFNTGLIPVLIIMENQADFYSLYDQVKDLPRYDRKELTKSILKDIVENSQVELMSVLHDYEMVGKVKDIRQLWVIDAVGVRITPSLIAVIANLPGIDRIHLDEERHVLPVESEVYPAQPTDDPTWSVNIVGGPAVWAQGYQGQGVIVAVVDTGVNYNHTDLMNRMWDGSPTYPLHGWDFYNNDNDPYDDHIYGGHGSHVSGIVAGDGTSGTQTGIAPQGTIMAVKTINSIGNGNETQSMQGMQFALDNGADIITMSLRWVISLNPDKVAWRTLSDNMLAAGMNHTNAAGNEGQYLSSYPIPNNIGTPSCIPPPWHHPDQIQPGAQSGVVTVASTTQSDVRSVFSSKGPCSWENINPWNDYLYQGGSLQGYLAPDIAAPGSDIISCTNQSNNGYLTMSGTSMATPQVAGIMALMLSKDPTLTPEQIDELVETTAVEKGAPGKDVEYGSGRIDALAAVNAVPGGTPMDVDVVLTPVSLPIQVPANGGTFDFNIAVTNNETSTVTCNVWTMVTLPNGTEYGPLINALKTFNPSSTANRDRTQAVPANAPSGNYTYDAYVGFYPTIVWNEDHFAFEKLAVADGGEIVSGWGNFGKALGEDTQSELADTPKEFVLHSAFPNPFNPETAISFSLSEAANVNLSVHDVTGRLVATLADGWIEQGLHSAVFDAQDLSSGVYFYTLTANNIVSTKKMMLLK